MKIWIIDPKTNTPSVSLTVFVIATIMYVAAIAANLFGVDLDTGLITQFWYGSGGLYFGRRLSVSKDGITDIQTKDK